MDSDSPQAMETDAPPSESAPAAVTDAAALPPPVASLSCEWLPEPLEERGATVNSDGAHGRRLIIHMLAATQEVLRQLPRTQSAAPPQR